MLLYLDIPARQVRRPKIKILVAGAGGFIGGHLVKKLSEQRDNFELLAIDQKNLKSWYQILDAENIVGDLKNLEFCNEIMQDVDIVYNLAADMGGMGFIEKHKADCMLSSIINTNLLLSARDKKVSQYFFPQVLVFIMRQNNLTESTLHSKK